MRLCCVWYEPPLKKRVPCDVPCEYVDSLTEALRIFRSAHDGINVLRAYNSACSVWIGYDKTGGIILANSKSEFMRYRIDNGGVLMNAV